MYTNWTHMAHFQDGEVSTCIPTGQMAENWQRRYIAFW